MIEVCWGKEWGGVGDCVGECCCGSRVVRRCEVGAVPRPPSLRRLHRPSSAALNSREFDEGHVRLIARHLGTIFSSVSFIVSI